MNLTYLKHALVPLVTFALVFAVNAFTVHYPDWAGLTVGAALTSVVHYVIDLLSA